MSVSNRAITGAFLMTVIVAGGCAGRTPGSGVNSDAALLVDFENRIDRYMELREQAADAVPEADVVTDPAKLTAREQALSARIRALRANAKHGDIFTPAIRAHFRRLLAPELKGRQGRDVRATVREDAPAPGAVPIEVNAKYPAGLPMSTTPPSLLLALPRLPAGLEYRLVGNDLLLLDQPADVIIDYIRNAIAKPVAQ
jgi:hypothetical protein